MIVRTLFRVASAVAYGGLYVGVMFAIPLALVARAIRQRSNKEGL